MSTKIYMLENLGCAHCAAKMEEKIGEIPGVLEATITFATKQLRVTVEDPDVYLDEIRKICSSIESQVKVEPRNLKRRESVKSEKAVEENAPELYRRLRGRQFLGIWLRNSRSRLRHWMAVRVKYLLSFRRR